MNKSQWTGLIVCLSFLLFSCAVAWSMSGLFHCGKPCPVPQYNTYNPKMFQNTPAFITEYNKQEGGEDYAKRETEKNTQELSGREPDGIPEQQIGKCYTSSEQNS